MFVLGPSYLIDGRDNRDPQGLEDSVYVRDRELQSLGFWCLGFRK